MQPFVFTFDRSLLQGENTRLVNVPKELSNKGALLSWYANALEFPEYFGKNWDAFDECLRDLSWMKERKLVLYHEGVPLNESPKDQEIYIDILARAAQDWEPAEAHEVVAAFHPVCELKLQAIARHR